MAIFYTEETAADNKVAGSNNDVFTREFNYTADGTETGTDSILITRLPKGAKVLGYSFVSGVMGNDLSFGTTVGGSDLFAPVETGAGGRGAVMAGPLECLSTEVYATPDGALTADTSVTGVIYFKAG